MEDSSIILNRLKKNLKKRKSLVKDNLNSAYRLYEKDIPEFPYIIDIYNQNAVIYEKGKKLDESDLEQIEKHQKHLNLILDAIKELLKINDSQIIVKKRSRQQGKEQYEQLSSKENFIIVHEHSFKFKVNLHDYLDTGLFLDHRPLRQIIYKNSEAKQVLNLFSYTGSISVAAAMGGGHVTTVDMSKTYLDWAQDNFEINELPSHKHQFLQVDAIKFISEKKFGKFDIIILDPPSFSNSKRMKDSFNIQDAHYSMIKNLSTHLKAEGVIYFSNNYREFKLDTRLTEELSVKNITVKSIPLDFRDMKIHSCFEIRNKKNL